MDQRRYIPKFNEDSGVMQPRRHRPDYRILLFMGLLMLIGLIVMYAIGPARANVLNNSYGTDYYTSTYFFSKQALSLLLALAAFGVMAAVPYKFIKNHAKVILISGLLACTVLAAAAVFNLGIAQCSLGACRWFNLGPLGSIQPAEIVKLGAVIFIAAFLGARIKAGKINDLYKTLLPLGTVAAVMALFIVVIQRDLGTGIALFSIIFSMLFIAGLNTKNTIIIGSILLLAGSLFIIGAEHRRERVATFLGVHQTNQSNDKDYHIEHAKIAIGSGGLLGVGIGNSVEATGYLPEAINDSVFAIMGETFGFIGLIAILFIFTSLMMRLLRASDHLSDPWMRLVVVGVFGWLAAHVLLNVASMIGVAPLTGITLPLLSFGGTSMIFIAGALGLVYQLTRYTDHEPAQHANNQTERTRYGRQDLGSRRGIGRTRHAGYRRTT